MLSKLNLRLNTLNLKNISKKYFSGSDKEIIHGEAAEADINRGINKLADAVQVTLIGDLIATIMYIKAAEGTINVQTGKTLEHEVEYVEGLKFDRGYISP